ncbi:DivIVA domain-containing protein, partial [Micromonospora zhanjiangensis]
MQAELEQVRSQGGPVVGGDDEQQALRVLMMAQRTADDHVSDARREADQLLSDARTKAEEVTREARAKADALERDARQRHQEAMGGLDAKRTALQKHIEELKQFEREYRTRLKAYLESQLRDLDGRGQGLEVEMTRTDGNRSGGTSAGLATAGLAGSYGGSRSGALESGR